MQYDWDTMTPERFRKLKACLLRRQLTLTVLMENVHKSRNFAAIIRSCDAVGISNAHATTETGHLPKHHMTAAGAHKWVNVHSYSNISVPLQKLRKKGFRILAAHVNKNSIDFRDANYTQPTAVVMGSELNGISEETALSADQCLKIPMQGLVESFNVSVAAALILYEAQRQREKAGMYEVPQISDAELRETLFLWSYPAIANYCQKHSLSYPELDEDGYIIGKLEGVHE